MLHLNQLLHTSRTARFDPEAPLLRSGPDHRQRSVTLYNPAKMPVRRYRYRGAQISTPFTLDDVDPAVPSTWNAAVVGIT